MSLSSPGDLPNEEVIKDVAKLRAQVEKLERALEFDLGITSQRLNPCERLFDLVTKTDNLRRAALKASNELYSFVRIHNLESTYITYMFQEADLRKQAFMVQDFQYWSSIAKKLDAQRSTSYTQITSDLGEAEVKFKEIEPSITTQVMPSDHHFSYHQGTQLTIYFTIADS